MEILSTDILVIGGGLAGMVSALEAEKRGIKVLLAGKFAIGTGTNSSLANGVFASANSRFSKEEHLEETLKAGRGLNHLPLVKAMIETAPEAMETLTALGVPLAETKGGYMIDRPTGSSQLAGILLVKALAERLKRSTIQPLRSDCRGRRSSRGLWVPERRETRSGAIEGCSIGDRRCRGDLPEK